MKRLIHEQLEESLFSQFQDGHLPSLRKAFFSDFDDKIRSEVNSQVNFALSEINPNMQDSVKTRLAKKDGWRVFAKQICSNYMLAFNYMLGQWHNNGNKVFKISEDLCEALYNTDIEIDTSNIKPPFNSFIIYTDGNCLKHIGEYSDPFGANKRVQEYFVSYIMVEFLDSISGVGKIMRMVFGYYDPGTDPDDMMNWNNSSFLELELEGKGKFRPKDGENCGLGHIFPEQSLFSEDDKEKAKKYNQDIINFIFSFMLYISIKKDDITIDRSIVPPITTQNPKKINQQIKKYREQSQYNVYYIGSKYEGIYKKSKNQFIGHELDHKLMVRGHWRDQWYGHREKLPDGGRTAGTYQETIWIEPFFKGLEFEQDNKATVFKVEG